MGKTQSKRKTTTPEREMAVTNLPFDIVLLVAKYHNWIPDGVVSHPVGLTYESIDAKCNGSILTIYHRRDGHENWTNEIDLKYGQLTVQCSKRTLWNSDEHHVIYDGDREWNLDRNSLVLSCRVGDWCKSYNLSEYRYCACWPEVIDGEWTCLFRTTNGQPVQICVDDKNVLRRNFGIYRWNMRKDNMSCVFDGKDQFFIFCDGTLTRQLSLRYTSSFSVVSFDIAEDGCIWVMTDFVHAMYFVSSVVKIDKTAVFEYKIRNDNWVESKRFICACDFNGGAFVVCDNYIETISAFAQLVPSSLWTVQIHDIYFFFARFRE